MGHLLLPLFLAALDIISTAAALLLSAYLRFDIIVPEKYLDMLVMQLPSFIILTLVFALLFKLYDRIWRSGSITIYLPSRVLLQDFLKTDALEKYSSSVPAMREQ